MRNPIRTIEYETGPSSHHSLKFAKEFEHFLHEGQKYFRRIWLTLRMVKISFFSFEDSYFSKSSIQKLGVTFLETLFSSQAARADQSTGLGDLNRNHKVDRKKNKMKDK